MHRWHSQTDCSSHVTTSWLLLCCDRLQAGRGRLQACDPGAVQRRGVAADNAAANHCICILQQKGPHVLQHALTLTQGDPAALEPCRGFLLGLATAASAARLPAPLAPFGLQAQDGSVSCLASWTRKAPPGVHCQ